MPLKLSASLLDVQNLCFLRDDQPILENLSFNLSEGEIMYISGPNGSGKSTLLKLLANLLYLESGIIRWTHVCSYAYLGHKVSIKHFASPIDNILYAANGYQQKCSPAAARIFLDKLQLGEPLSAFEQRNTVSFSFGQQRKISMACIMASNRPVWILDEPFTGLDETAKGLLNECFQEKIKQGGSIIMASHLAPDNYQKAMIL